MRYSIITPCYKQEKLVTQTMDSVLAQKSKDWEHLCTDDGGPDATGEVLDAYVRAHCDEIKEYEIEQGGERKRVLEGAVRGGGVIKVIHQKNAGMAGARNAAKLLATGDWHINLDGDDLLPPFMMEELDRCIAACPDADMIHGGFLRFEDGTVPDWGEHGGELRIIDASGELDGKNFPSAFQEIVVNRRVCGDLPLSGTNWSEERLYTARCMARINKIVECNSYFYGYREHAGQFTRHGITINELKGYADSNFEILDIYIASGRPVSPRLYRSMILHMVEWMPRYIIKVLPQPYKEEGWNYWFESLPKILRYKISPWVRFVVTACRASHSIGLAWLLCYLPDWLKTKGIHR